MRVLEMEGCLIGQRIKLLVRICTSPIRLSVSSLFGVMEINWFHLVDCRTLE